MTEMQHPSHPRSARTELFPRETLYEMGRLRPNGDGAPATWCAQSRGDTTKPHAYCETEPSMRVVFLLLIEGVYHARVQWSYE